MGEDFARLVGPLHFVADAAEFADGVVLLGVAAPEGAAVEAGGGCGGGAERGGEGEESQGLHCGEDLCLWTDEMVVIEVLLMDAMVERRMVRASRTAYICVEVSTYW